MVLSQTLHFFWLLSLFLSRKTFGWLDDWLVRMKMQDACNDRVRRTGFSSWFYCQSLCDFGQLSAASSALFLWKMKFQMFFLKYFQAYNTWQYWTSKQIPLCYPVSDKTPDKAKNLSQPSPYCITRKHFDSTLFLNMKQTIIPRNVVLISYYNYGQIKNIIQTWRLKDVLSLFKTVSCLSVWKSLSRLKKGC